MSESKCVPNFSSDNNNVNKVSFPYKISKVDDDTNDDLLQNFEGEKTGFIQVGPDKWFFPSGYEKQAEKIYNFQARPDDVWIITFPRSGTTWTQEMVWLLANNLDYETAANIPLTMRYPFLEYSCFLHEEKKKEFLIENAFCKENCQLLEDFSKPLCEQLDSVTQRRFIKTHLPFSLLPKNLLEVGCKVIYVARNPKDVAVSFYHLNRSMRTQGYTGSFPKYWDYFKRNLQPWAPYWNHIFEGWERKNKKNLLFMFYEDINKNLRPVLKKVQHFLGEDYNEDELRKLESHLDIANFKHNTSVNFDILKTLGILVKGEQDFVRVGKTGGWKNYFDDELDRDANQWIEDNLKNSDLKFPDPM